ncbi:DUF4232 domain-containing protein [Streptomyces sp. RerS4]|uniref:DUF4232 domain-containing protein n=1 Tax=Streptomyces sp. RerS4 TaxID=2942449 RepID=UPI00201BDF53|nr:DUF4232 domain-containing protein [Streptomyces sp. RerS4]UQX04442.1 DUF4232 domain-containing protein [Streptomyces sp. RerS4]
MKRTRSLRTASSLLLTAVVITGTLTAGVTSAAATDAPASAPQAPAAPCTHNQLVANSAQRVGATVVRVTVINEGPKPCVLRGFPTVALAGQGSPDKNRPLTVTRQGKAGPVTLRVGGTASTLIGFKPVLGEADGYCASGAEPTVAPSMVVGVAGGALQLGPADGGDFALCGTTVTATAFR